MSTDKDDLAASNFVNGLATSAADTPPLPFNNAPDHLLDALSNVRAQNAQARERYHTHILPLSDHAPNQVAVAEHAFLEAPVFQCLLKKSYKFNGMPVTLHQLITDYLALGDQPSANVLRNFLHKKFGTALWLHQRDDYSDVYLDPLDEVVSGVFLKAKQSKFVTELAPYAYGIAVGTEPDLGTCSEVPSALVFRLTPVRRGV